MCKFYKEDQACPHAEKGLHMCVYAHGKYDICCDADGRSQYKTNPCRELKKKKFCKYGDDCIYYHDEAERRHFLTDKLPRDDILLQHL